MLESIDRPRTLFQIRTVQVLNSNPPYLHSSIGRTPNGASFHVYLLSIENVFFLYNIANEVEVTILNDVNMFKAIVSACVVLYG